MEESQIDKDPNFTRAMFMLEKQMFSVDEFVHFWKLYGPARVGPDIERSEPWWGDIISM